MNQPLNQPQSVSILNVSIPNGEIVLTLPVSCAWCLAEAGLPMGEGSHGICKDHAHAILAKRKTKNFSIPSGKVPLNSQ